MKLPVWLFVVLFASASCSEGPTDTTKVVKDQAIGDRREDTNEVLLGLALNAFATSGKDDFADYAGFQDVKWSEGMAPDLLLLKKTAEPNHYSSLSQMRGELRDKGKENDIDQLFLHINEEKPAAMDISGFRSFHKRFKFVDELPKSEYGFRNLGKAKGWVECYTPLIDMRETYALVRIDFGETPHGACGTFFFRKGSDGKWALKWTDCALYA